MKLVVLAVLFSAKLVLADSYQEIISKNLELVSLKQDEYPEVSKKVSFALA